MPEHDLLALRPLFLDQILSFILILGLIQLLKTLFEFFFVFSLLDMVHVEGIYCAIFEFQGFCDAKDCELPPLSSWKRSLLKRIRYWQVFRDHWLELPEFPELLLLLYFFLVGLNLFQNFENFFQLLMLERDLEIIELDLGFN